MKRYYKLLLIVVMMVFLTGCMKMEVNMSIRKNKSMELDIISAVDKSLTEGEGVTSSTDEKELEKWKKAGFSVTGYDKDGKTGIEAIKEFKNIDDVSGDKDVYFDLNKLMDAEAPGKIFKVKKGFIKNHYYAKLKADTSAAQGSTENQQFKETDLNDLDTSALMSSMDLAFKVNLPYKATTHNATSVDNDGKSLKWDLTKVKEDMFFEFDLYNMTNVYIVIGVVLFVVIMLASAFITKGGSKKPTIAKELSNNNPSLVQSDSSDGRVIIDDNTNRVPVAGQPTMNQAPVDNSMNQVPPENNMMNQPQVDSNPPINQSSSESADALNDLYNG